MKLSFRSGQQKERTSSELPRRSPKTARDQNTPKIDTITFWFQVNAEAFSLRDRHSCRGYTFLYRQAPASAHRRDNNHAEDFLQQETQPVAASFGGKLRDTVLRIPFHETVV